MGKRINQLPENTISGSDLIPFWKQTPGTTSQNDFASFKCQSYTYAELAAMKAASTLVQGMWYEISDFATKHLIPRTTNVINTGTITPLMVMATDVNDFGLIAYQKAYPNDVLEYDFTNNLCEDGTTARTGWIQARYNSSNNIYTAYDWRECKMRRWTLNTTVHTAWNSGTTYSRDQTATFGGFLYVSNISSNLNHQPDVTDGYWTKMFDTSLYWFHRPTAFSIGGISITPDSNVFIDCYTFNNSTNNTLSTLPRNIRIERLHYDDGFLAANYGGTNNIVFQIGSAATFCCDVHFEPDCFDCSFIIGTGAVSLTNLRFSHIVGLIFTRNANAWELWERTANLVTGINNSSIVGRFSSCVFGDTCSNISAQLGQTLRFTNNNSTINILGATAFLVLVGSLARLFVNRPQGDINLLTTVNSGTIIGTHAGAYTAITGRISSSGSEINLIITKTFDGTSGKGAVGSVTLDDSFAVPNGYRISQIQTKQTSLAGAGAVINMGFTGNTDAGLDDTSGAIAALTAGTITNVQPLDTESASDSNVLVMSVKNNAITAGTLILAIRLTKNITT